MRSERVASFATCVCQARRKPPCSMIEPCRASDNAPRAPDHRRRPNSTSHPLPSSTNPRHAPNAFSPCSRLRGIFRRARGHLPRGSGIRSIRVGAPSSSFSTSFRQRSEAMSLGARRDAERSRPPTSSHGHRFADLDPLRLAGCGLAIGKRRDSNTAANRERSFARRRSAPSGSARDAEALHRIYAGTLAIETAHIDDARLRSWLVEAFEKASEPPSAGGETGSSRPTGRGRAIRQLSLPSNGRRRSALAAKARKRSRRCCIA